MLNYIIAIVVIAALLWAYKRINKQSNSRVSRGSNNSAIEGNLIRCIDLIGDGEFYYDEVVGESFYQENIMKSFELRGEKTDKVYWVRLTYEDGNPHDNKAIAVYSEYAKLKIGHLSKREARNYRRRMSVLGFEGYDASCEAKVFGGGKKKSYGIFLNYDPRLTKKHYMKLKQAQGSE